MTTAQHATAVIVGVAVGLVAFAPILYGLYRLDCRANDRRRAKSAAVRAAMQRHPAGKGPVIESEIETSAYNRREAS